MPAFQPLRSPAQEQPRGEGGWLIDIAHSAMLISIVIGRLRPHVLQRARHRSRISGCATSVLCAEGVMYDELRRDYAAMATMIFSTPLRFEDVIESVAALEARLNSSNVVA